MRWRCADMRCDLVVRPDTHAPPRDPFAYYGLSATRGADHRAGAPAARAGVARRVGYLAFAAGRAIGSGRADVLMTRDLDRRLAVAADAASDPRAVVYESHGYAPDVAAALPAMVSTATAAQRRETRAPGAREAPSGRG